MDPPLASSLTQHRKAFFGVSFYRLGLYGGTSFLYFLSNFLGLVSLSQVSASTFQFILNTKIVFVAAFTVSLSTYSAIRFHQWLSTGIIVIATSQLTLLGKMSSTPGQESTVDTGALLVLVVSASSALSNVYNQVLLQDKEGEPIMVQNAQLYLTGVIFNLFNWYGSIHVWRSYPHLIGEWNYLCTWQIVFLTLYGLVISLVLKRFGAMARTISGCISLVVTAVADHFFFSEHISLIEGSTFILVIVATVLYTHKM